MAQVVDITALLQAAQSADAAQRHHAEAKLKELEADAPSFLLSLSAHLSVESNGVDTRRLAGEAALLACDHCDQSFAKGSLADTVSTFSMQVSS